MQIIHAISDNLEALYIDGELVSEGSHIDFDDTLSLLVTQANTKNEKIYFESVSVDQDWLENWSCFPSHFHHIPKDMICIN